VLAISDSTPLRGMQVDLEGIEVVQVGARPGSEQDSIQTTELARARQGAWVALDGYQFDAEFQHQVKERGSRLLVIDDGGQAGQYFADLVLDQNLDAPADAYSRREPHTRLLLGLNYALLRRQFRCRGSWKREISGPAKRILVMAGGTDPDGLSLQVLAVVPHFRGEIEIDVVSGAANPSLAQLKESARRLEGRTRVHVAVTDVAELMANSDIAIVCGGGTLWESLCMGCATLSFARNPVQKQIIENLCALGAVGDLGCVGEFDATRLASVVNGLVSSAGCRTNMAAKGRTLVDGKGAERVVEAMRA
jgi:UDP-2,4-diacetamido-2,4,6-trideoxy-beta-L-altropyranose hydrolase